MVFGSQPCGGAETARERSLPRSPVLPPLWKVPGQTYLQVDAEKPGELGLRGAAGQRAQDHAGGPVLSSGGGEEGTRQKPPADLASPLQPC